jgi:hypothetical protein
MTTDCNNCSIIPGGDFDANLRQGVEKQISAKSTSTQIQQHTRGRRGSPRHVGAHSI